MKHLIGVTHGPPATATCQWETNTLNAGTTCAVGCLGYTIADFANGGRTSVLGQPDSAALAAGTR